jgi:hypothetical protein
LKNRPRQEVATKVAITGDVESPQTSTWQMIVMLVQNAFFKAILPGLDRELTESNVQVAQKEQNSASQPSEKPAPAAERPNTAQNAPQSPG